LNIICDNSKRICMSNTNHMFISKVLPSVKYKLKMKEKELKLLLTSLIDWVVDWGKIELIINDKLFPHLF